MADAKIRRLIKGKIDPWQTDVRPTWTVAQTKAALYRHQLGDFSLSALLADAMMADDELPSCMARAVNLIVGAPFQLVPTEGEAASEGYADELDAVWHQCFPEHEIARLVHWFLFLGVAIGTIDYEVYAGKWWPRLRALHPQWLRYDAEYKDEETGLFGVWMYQSRDGDIPVKPGDGKWIVLSDGRDSWMQASVRALATAWLVKQFAWRDWQRYNERHGLPIIKAKVPFVTEGADKQEFFDDVKQLGSDTTILLPSHLDENGAGFDLELLEAMDGSWESFRETIERCDRKFQVHLLGTNSGAELIGTAGSRATSESGRDIAREVASARARRLTTDIREQLVIPFLRLNYGDFDEALAPWPTFQIEEGADNKTQGDGWAALAGAISAFKLAGYKVANVEEIAEEAGLVLEEAPVEMAPDGTPMQPGQEAPPAEENDDSEELAQLAVADVGKREGFEAGQRYLDRLTDALTGEAAKAEDIGAEQMLEIIDASKDPADMRARLSAYLGEVEPILLARVFEKAILLSSLAGRFAVQEDL